MIRRASIAEASASRSSRVSIRENRGASGRAPTLRSADQENHRIGRECQQHRQRLARYCTRPAFDGHRREAVGVAEARVGGNELVNRHGLRCCAPLPRCLRRGRVSKPSVSAKVLADIAAALAPPRSGTDAEAP
ncbi:hypothetical protein predicted by Glimmer/Critica [Sorangium cellulosum So ce56]|uniref:Uncharacterized protein n=1 Tax=Sorangium cellulosum (strain So ce56) TaxID=448385 RepID=A9FTP7_SORC5|nr:hypothetical protein predicted by Glimmer/Critica [Sorangium cellulosum So ce56]